MKIIIEPCSNGAFVIIDDGENQEKSIYKFDETNVMGLQELLYDVNDTLNLSGRYDKMRIKVNIEHGDKYECDGCDICGIGENK
jgi:hypothetical protein